MSRWLPETAARRLLVGIDATGIAVRGASMPADAAHWLPHTEAARLGELAGAHARAVAEVVVAGDAAVHWVQQPPAGAQGLQELRAVAAARCAHLFGGTALDWWVAGDWHAAKPFVCAGVPRALAEPVRRQLESAGLRTTWQSAWTRLCNRRLRAIPANGWSACRSPGRVTLWYCAGGRVASVQSFAVPRSAAREELAARVAERQKLEALADAAIAIGGVHWLTGSLWQGAQTEAEAALELGDRAIGAAAR